MESVELRVINGRTYDLHMFTKEASQQVQLLLDQYQHHLNELEVLKRSFHAKWIFEESNQLEEYYRNRDQLVYLLKDIETTLENIDNDTWNHKGVTMGKTLLVIKKVVFSKWSLLALIGLFTFATGSDLFTLLQGNVQQHVFDELCFDFISVIFYIRLFWLSRKRKRSYIRKGNRHVA